MKMTRLIARLCRQTLAAWTMVLPLLLAWSVGTTALQAGAEFSVRSVSVSVQWTPELAAVQANMGASQRATDDRYSVGPDPFLKVSQIGSAFAADATKALTEREPDRPFARDHCPHSPRAPPSV